MGGINFNFYIVEQLPVLPPDRYTPDLLRFIVPRVLELSYTAWDLTAFAGDVWAEADADLRRVIACQWQANVDETGGHVDAQPPAWLDLLAPSPRPQEPRAQGRNESQENATVPSPAPGPASEGFPHPPFKWDDERRFRLRCELDALYAHLYQLERGELDYILDTFPIVRRKDVDKYGEYRTKRAILAAYDRL